MNEFEKTINFQDSYRGLMSSPKSRLINYKIKVNAGEMVCSQTPHQARQEGQLYRESKLSFARINKSDHKS